MNAPSPKKPMNDLALVSLVSGILSWVMFPIAAAIVGVVAGHMARAKIRQTGEDGDLFALIGMGLGYAHLLLTCVLVAGFIALYAGLFAFIGFSQLQ